MRGAAVVAVSILVLAACARPNSTVQTFPTPTPTPTPSPSPTPTAPLMAAAPSFHIGEVGVAYGSVALTATGGVQPYAWSVSAGAIPAGLSLGNDGNLSGTPTSGGSFSFTIQVADSKGSIATVPGAIKIAPALSASLIPSCATQCSVELGCANACGDFGQVSGGIAPYTYSQTSGQLPAGTSLAGMVLTGTFTGLSGYLKFSVQVTDSLGATATVTPTFWMYDHISFRGGSVTCPYNGCAAASTFPYQGGIGTPTVRVAGWTVSCTYPPCYPAPVPPVSASAGSVYVNVPRSGGGNGYQGVLTLVLTDGASCAPGTNCSASGSVNVTVQSG